MGACACKSVPSSPASAVSDTNDSRLDHAAADYAIVHSSPPSSTAGSAAPYRDRPFTNEFLQCCARDVLDHPSTRLPDVDVRPADVAAPAQSSPKVQAMTRSVNAGVPPSSTRARSSSPTAHRTHAPPKSTASNVYAGGVDARRERPRSRSTSTLPVRRGERSKSVGPAVRSTPGSLGPRRKNFRSVSPLGVAPGRHHRSTSTEREAFLHDTAADSYDGDGREKATPPLQVEDTNANLVSMDCFIFL